VVIAVRQQTHAQRRFGDHCGQTKDLKNLPESLIRNMALANGLFEISDDGEGGYAVCDLYLSVDSQGMDAL
jgi:hypothetical protein